LGLGGTELIDVGEGDFIYKPAHLIHRETVAAEGGKGVVVRVGGVAVLAAVGTPRWLEGL